MDNSKKCKHCKKIKILSDFHKSRRGKDGLYAWCKICISEHRKKPDQRKRLSQYAMSEKRRMQIRNYALKKMFGVDLEQYSKMFIEQNGNCAICGRNQSEFKYKLAVDHCHKTKKVRSLLCHYCNMGIGCFKESPSTMLAAIKYIEVHLG